MRQSGTGKTPKVFNTSYVPPKRLSANGGVSNSLAWRPVVRVLFVVAVIFALSRLPVFKIKQVNIEGADNALLKEELQSLVGQSIFSSTVSRTTERWLRQERSLAALTCHRGLPSSLSCQATMRSPAIIWVQSGREFLVDEEGVLYAEKSGQPLDVPLLEDRVNTDSNLGSQVASREIVEQVIRLKKILSEQSVTTKSLFVADSLYQLGALITSYVGADGQPVQKELTALFISTQPIESQVKALRTLLKERGGSIKERVDLRIPGYVYYK
ncbi:MAG: hypothetical protein HZB70_00100 [Candidatus Berkelbacteria bacterium]|nr:MAG: hypothetical protein HZB70_00100 [Candidatus Berkelbacteria bacterium]QQG51485.1 MAG: hypothetical protein HY845_02900 [Candidatus Berkelbacteria bacterium]